MIRIILTALLPLLLVSTSLLPTDACALQESTRYAKEQFTLRAEPASDAKALVTVQRDQKLTISECDSGWCPATVIVNGESVKGYAPENKLTRTPAGSATQVRTCCKICKKGKACGNSCISRSKTCHKGPGCACNG